MSLKININQNKKWMPVSCITCSIKIINSKKKMVTNECLTTCSIIIINSKKIFGDKNNKLF